jgi:large subunit ribosomal protein L29
MKMTGLRDLTKEELLQKRHEIKEELFNLRMRKTFKELDNPLKLRTLRRDLARIETVLSEDRQGIRQIVDTPVSILDRKSAAGEEKQESTESENKDEAK